MPNGARLFDVDRENQSISSSFNDCGLGVVGKREVAEPEKKATNLVNAVIEVFECGGKRVCSQGKRE